MISDSIFSTVRDRYGEHASWAVWGELDPQEPFTAGSDDGRLDLPWDPEKGNDSLLQVLHGEVVMCGLNPGNRFSGETFRNFHGPGSNMFRVAEAARGTLLWGAYMTDLMPETVDSDSEVVLAVARTSGADAAGVARLEEEIAALGATDPWVLCFGREVHRLVTRHSELKAICVPHYAQGWHFNGHAGKTHAVYRQWVHDACATAGFVVAPDDVGLPEPADTRIETVQVSAVARAAADDARDGGTPPQVAENEVDRIRAFWRNLELNDVLGIRTIDDFWDWLGSGCRSPRPDMWFPAEDELLLYRGQVDDGYSLSSFLFREVRRRTGGEVRERDMLDAEDAILRTARGEGIGRRMTDLQLLMLLQHHGVPTRLMDFARTPFEALYFAVEGQDSVDGRYFVIHLSDPSLALDDASSDPKALPWAGQARSNGKPTRAWGRSVVQLADTGDLDARLVAQNGTFVTGGVMTSGTGRYQHAPGPSVITTTEELQAVSSLALFFASRRGVGKHQPNRSGFEGFGWSVRIPAAWKPELRRRLARLDEPITRDSIYPPIDESRRLLLHTLGQPVTTSIEGARDTSRGGAA